MATEQGDIVKGAGVQPDPRARALIAAAAEAEEWLSLDDLDELDRQAGRDARRREHDDADHS